MGVKVGGGCDAGLVRGKITGEAIMFIREESQECWGFGLVSVAGTAGETFNLISNVD